LWFNKMFSYMFHSHCMSTVCLLYVYCMSTVCLLYVYCMSTVCLLYVYCIVDGEQEEDNKIQIYNEDIIQYWYRGRFSN